MATKYWTGAASAVAQVDTITIGGTLAGETFSISVNGKVIATHTDADTNVQSARDALVTAWQASTSPYATPITAAAGASSGELTLTADDAGFPFVVTVNTPGGAATFVLVNTTANVGPNDWNEAGNWSDGIVPVSTDTVIFRDSDIDVCWGIDQNAITLDKLVIERSYTGRIGLRKTQLATKPNGRTNSKLEPEYRETYLKIGWQVAEIGEARIVGAAVGSDRLKLSNTRAGISTTTIFETSSQSSDSGLPSVRLLFANSGANLFVRKAGSGVGVAVDTPGETSTVGEINVATGIGSRGRVIVGEGVTLTSFSQDGGECTLRAAATISSVSCAGGVLHIEGTAVVTTLTVTGGKVYPNNVASGADVGTLDVHKGEVDSTRSNEDRTWTTVNLNQGAKLVVDPSHLTITTLNHPSSRKFTLSIAS